MFRVEDCVQNPSRLGKIFHDNWGVEVEPEFLSQVVARHSFATLSGGRPPGQEDVHSHYRKGTPGEWQKHFTPELAGRFESLFGDVLLMGGYERAPGWSERSFENP